MLDALSASEDAAARSVRRRQACVGVLRQALKAGVEEGLDAAITPAGVRPEAAVGLAGDWQHSPSQCLLSARVGYLLGDGRHARQEAIQRAAIRPRRARGTERADSDLDLLVIEAEKWGKVLGTFVRDALREGRVLAGG